MYLSTPISNPKNLGISRNKKAYGDPPDLFSAVTKQKRKKAVWGRDYPAGGFYPLLDLQYKAYWGAQLQGNTQARKIPEDKARDLSKAPHIIPMVITRARLLSNSAHVHDVIAACSQVR